MSETKYPFEYELTTLVQSVQTGFQEYVIRFKNTGQDALVNLQARLHLIKNNRNEDVDLSFGTLGPNEPKTMAFLAHDSVISDAYLSVCGQERNWDFYWDQEVGEIRSEQKNQVKAKIEAQIARIKEQYCRSIDVFDSWCKKNEEDVDEWMIGHKPIETGSNNC